MLLFRLLCIILLLNISGEVIASENYHRQAATVLMLYETLALESPSVEQFFHLFGKDNESELELILRQQFPTLNLKGNWFDNKEAKNYVDEIYKHPALYPSRFLSCFKSAMPKLFASKNKRLLEFPPSVTNDVKTFSVFSQGEKIIFEFSSNEQALDNIYLSTGKSIYELIPDCK